MSENQKIIDAMAEALAWIDEGDRITLYDLANLRDAKRAIQDQNKRITALMRKEAQQNINTVRLNKRVARLEAALQRIAAYEDDSASRRLKETGSYNCFDEPFSVRVAREALGSSDE